MKIKDILSKEHAVNGLKSLGKLRIKTTHSALMTFSPLLLILLVSFTIRVFPLRWEIQTGSVHLTEFDPYFQYRFADYMVKNGFISWAWPEQWVDTQRWYPKGINVAKAGFPGLSFTAAFLYKIVSALGVNVDLMSFCALLAPILGMLASLVIYFLGKDMGGKTMGLLAALFLALSPSYIQRSAAGWFDDEIIGILSLLLFILLFLRAIEEDRPTASTIRYALGSGVVLGYFCAGWGAAYYPIGVTALFVFVLILLKRYTQRLFLSYSLTFGLGLFIAISIPKLTASYLFETAILPIAIVFVLLCLGEVFRALTSMKWRVIATIVFMAMLIGSFLVLWTYRQDLAGKFISVINPITRLESPLIESVAEHRISGWGSIYYEFGIGIIFFIVGLYFVLRDLNNKNLFLLIFGLTSLYFACSMVRLLVLMAPAFALLAASGVVGILRPFVTLLKEPPKISVKKRYGLEHVGKEFSGTAVFLIFIILMTNLAFTPQAGGTPRVYRQAYSPVTVTASSLPIAPNEPVREWLDMLEWTRLNLKSTDVVCSWWDYGYWLTILGNVTTLGDNATIDTYQIENLGFIFIANETDALRMLKIYGAKYILVFTTIDAQGNWINFGDEGKWAWMARISGKASERLINDGFVDRENMWTDATPFGNYTLGQDSVEQDGETTPIANARGQATTIYKLMTYAMGKWKFLNNLADSAPTESLYFKEAFIAGVNLGTSDANSKYGGIVPLIALYEINYTG